MTIRCTQSPLSLTNSPPRLTSQTRSSVARPVSHVSCHSLETPFLYHPTAYERLRCLSLILTYLRQTYTYLASFSYTYRIYGHRSERDGENCSVLGIDGVVIVISVAVNLFQRYIVRYFIMRAFRRGLKRLGYIIQEIDAVALIKEDCMKRRSCEQKLAILQM